MRIIYFRKQLHCVLLAFQNKQFSFTFAAHLILERHEKSLRTKAANCILFILAKSITKHEGRFRLKQRKKIFEFKNESLNLLTILYQLKQKEKEN